MTDFETHPAGTADLVKRLQKRAEEDRAIQKNNEAVASALRGQRLLFDQGIHSPSNNFAVRLCLEYENCAKNDAKLAQDWEDAADRIEQLEAALARANAATAAAYEAAAMQADEAEVSTWEFIAPAIRDLATPDQTAALDRLIADAVGPHAEALAWYETQFCEGFCEDMPDRSVTNAGMENDCSGCKARAILAASKKGGV